MLHRRWFQGMVGLPMVVACGMARAQTPTAPTAPYETATVMASLRPEARADFSRAVRVEDIPRYDLALTLADDNRTFTLHEVLWFTNSERVALSEVVLRVYANVTAGAGASTGLTALSAGNGAPTVPTAPTVPAVVFAGGRCAGSVCTVASEGPSVIAVHPATAIPPGGHIRVELDLRGTLPEIVAGRTNLLAQGMESMAMMGSGGSGGDYGVLSTGEGIASLGGFYPVLARRRVARWERTDASTIGDLGSDDLSNVHAVITTAPGVRVATTGRTVQQVTVMPAGGVPTRQRVEVVAAAVRDFAVLAGSTLADAERRVDDVTVRSWFLPADRAAGERVLDVGAAALTVYGQRFGRYPYTELDLVEAPLVGGAGGVEFPGLVTVASMFYHQAVDGTAGTSAGSGAGGAGGAGGLLGMLGGAGVTDALSRMVPAMLEFVTAHEVAHQYWHALVGSDSREHPFVDESLAQWSASLYLEDRYGAVRARHDADMQVRMNYQFMRMMGQADGAVDRPAAAFGTPTAYAGLVYGKGPYLYNALRTAVGDGVFFRGVRRYVETWRYREAPPGGFTDALAVEAPHAAGRIHGLARRWLEESHGDEDLGQADMRSLISGLLGAQGPDASAVQGLLQQLAPMLQGNGPGGGTAGGANANPGAGADPAALQQVLEHALDGLGQ